MNCQVRWASGQRDTPAHHCVTTDQGDSPTAAPPANDAANVEPKQGRNSRPMRRAYSTPHRKHRPSPRGAEWKEDWGKAGFNDGRVLVLDYVSRDFSDDGRRRILANEFHSPEQLGKFYKFEAPKRTPALRVIHVQNSRWAR